MAVDLDDTALVRWRASPIAFIEEMLHDPETGRPFVLLEAERAFMRHAFTLDRNGRFAYPELVYGAIKKSGKTTCAALIVLVMVLLRSDGRFAEGYCIANDLEQAQSRVFLVVRRIVEASPLLRHGAKITSDRISFPALDASITAIASDAASAERKLERFHSRAQSIRQAIIHLENCASVRPRSDSDFGCFRIAAKRL